MRNLFLLLLIATSIGCNQQFHERHANDSKEQIINLKEKGALVVRLRNENKKIEALKKRGNIQWAENVATEAAKNNKATMVAFEKEFDFCPVYFIYEQNSVAIREKEVKKGIFLNNRLEVDESIVCGEEYILTAEFGVTEPDTASFYDHSYTYQLNDSSEVRETRYKEYNTNVTGLVIKSDHFIQLHRPFPYYVREYTAIVLSRKKEEMVRILNRNLHAFYKQQKQ